MLHTVSAMQYQVSSQASLLYTYGAGDVMQMSTFNFMHYCESFEVLHSIVQGIAQK